jgi:sorbitol-specific phosphotransferase system component IIC
MDISTAKIGPVRANNSNVRQLRKRDRQLIRMLLIQCICTVILTLPIAVQKLYATFTQNAIKDVYQLAAENFVAQLLRMLTYINSSTSFYMWV